VGPSVMQLRSTELFWFIIPRETYPPVIGYSQAMRSESSTVGDVFAAVNDLWPFAVAEEWDRVGLSAGSAQAPATRVLLVVDVTEQTVKEAITGGYDVILAHHPLLLRGVTSLDESTSKGALLSSLIRENIALIAAHTNADSPHQGVAAVFAEKLHLKDTRPIQANHSDDRIGIGRVGSLKPAITLQQLAERVAGFLPPSISGIRVAGDPNQLVHRVAVSPGAGDSLLGHPLVRQADAYITADLRHHPASESREETVAQGSGPALLDVSHFASEWVWLDTAAGLLAAVLPGVHFTVSEKNTDSWDFSVAAINQRPQSEA
jgi:dinuclear metal center YbgI/SA1388 family protein